MSQLKRITISFSGKDADLSDFFGHQQNASLSLRLICKRWIAQHGTGDVADLLATKFSNKDTNEPDLGGHSNTSQNNQSVNSAIINNDIDDDFDNL